MSSTLQPADSCQSDSRMVCFLCEVELPLRLPHEGDEVERFACSGCGSVYPGVFDESAPAEVRKNARREKRRAPEPAKPKLVLPAPRGVETQVPNAHSGVTCPFETQASRWLDAQVNEGSALVLPPAQRPFLLETGPLGMQPFDEALLADLHQALASSTTLLDKLFRRVNDGGVLQLEPLTDLTDATLHKASDDLDMFVALGINPTQETPFNHGLHVAMLAMAMGATMGLDRRALEELGLGCLLHDAGMSRVEGKLHLETRALSSKELTAISKHPIHTFELLQDRLDAVPAGARMVAYQMHERCDGSGYPRGRKAPMIHRLAKIAAVADVYVALVSSRPQRRGVIPYHAVRHLLFGARDGMYDNTAVRALLHTVSLFPLGSFVQLSDGRVGRVVRSNRVAYHQPIVELVESSGRPGQSGWLDLSQTPGLTVAQALTAQN